MSEEVKQNQGEDSNKVAKQYEDNVKKLVSLLKGEKNTKSNIRIPNSEVAGIIDELLKEKKEAKVKEFKEKVGKVLENKVAFDRFVKEKQKEFDKAITDKKKDLNKEATECFALLESIEQLHKDYTTSIEGSEPENIS